MVRVMAPYTPFLTELMYQNLRLLTHRQEKSVHFVMMPQPRFEPLVSVAIREWITSSEVYHSNLCLVIEQTQIDAANYNQK